jgi:hypothetical protein
MYERAHARANAHAHAHTRSVGRARKPFSHHWAHGRVAAEVELRQRVAQLQGRAESHRAVHANAVAAETKRAQPVAANSRESVPAGHVRRAGGLRVCGLQRSCHGGGARVAQAVRPQVERAEDRVFLQAISQVHACRLAHGTVRESQGRDAAIMQQPRGQELRAVAVAHGVATQRERAQACVGGHVQRQCVDVEVLLPQIERDGAVGSDPLQRIGCGLRPRPACCGSRHPLLTVVHPSTRPIHIGHPGQFTYPNRSNRYRRQGTRPTHTRSRCGTTAAVDFSLGSGRLRSCPRSWRFGGRRFAALSWRVRSTSSCCVRLKSFLSFSSGSGRRGHNDCAELKPKGPGISAIGGGGAHCPRVPSRLVRVCARSFSVERQRPLCILLVRGECLARWQNRGSPFQLRT